MEITSRFANGVFIFNILSKRHKMGHSSSSKVSPNLETWIFDRRNDHTHKKRYEFFESPGSFVDNTNVLQYRSVRHESNLLHFELMLTKIVGIQTSISLILVPEALSYFQGETIYHLSNPPTCVCTLVSNKSDEFLYSCFSFSYWPLVWSLPSAAWDWRYRRYRR